MGMRTISERSSLGETLFGQTRQRILTLLFGHPDERFYQRRIIQAVGLGSGTVQSDLERLSRSGVLTQSVEGRQIYFQANRRCPIFEELHGIVRKTFGVSTSDSGWPLSSAALRRTFSFVGSRTQSRRRRTVMGRMTRPYWLGR